MLGASMKVLFGAPKKILRVRHEGNRPRVVVPVFAALLSPSFYFSGGGTSSINSRRLYRTPHSSFLASKRLI